MAPKNIFVVGVTEDHWTELHTVVGAESDIKFHGLLSKEEVVDAEEIRMRDLVDKAHDQLKPFEGSVDGIIAQWDFPTTLLVPMLSNELGLRSPSLDSVLQCGHKYWSRKAQRDSIPEYTPEFQRIDPFQDDAADQVTLEYPYWFKPVVGYSSQLGFLIESREDLDEALKKIRAELPRMAEPFDRLIDELDVDPSFREVTGAQCLAEEYLKGEEIALEGHVLNGEVTIHGSLDMHRSEHSFTALIWRSQKSPEILQKMEDATRRFLKHINFDNGCFNCEFFWDAEKQKLSVIEFNPRISQSHSPMCILVDGRSNHEVAVDVALGRKPRYEPGGGQYEVAAKFVERVKKDGVVKKVPSEVHIAALEKQFPTAEIHLDLKEGRLLSKQNIPQDAFTYEVAEIFMGGRDLPSLEKKHRELLRELDVEIEGVSIPDDLVGINEPLVA